MPLALRRDQLVPLPVLKSFGKIGETAEERSGRQRHETNRLGCYRCSLEAQRKPLVKALSTNHPYPESGLRNNFLISNILKSISFINQAQLCIEERNLKEVLPLINGVFLARDLINLPANLINPEKGILEK